MKFDSHAAEGHHDSFCGQWYPSLSTQGVYHLSGLREPEFNHGVWGWSPAMPQGWTQLVTLGLCLPFLACYLLP